MNNPTDEQLQDNPFACNLSEKILSSIYDGQDSDPYYGLPDFDGAETSMEKQRRWWHWLLLLCPPLATAFFGTIFFISIFMGFGPLGAILCLLTPLVCTVWGFLISMFLARGSILSLVGLFVLELFLIYGGCIFIPRWD